MKIAIVTFELEGLTKNGGIGTAYRRLAELLAEAGHSVTVVFMPLDVQPGSSRARWHAGIARLRRKGLRVEIPGDGSVRFRPGQAGYFLGRSSLVCRYLEEGRFDVVHAPDNCGLVYLSLQAKRAGNAFARTRFIVGAHGPRVWSEGFNGRLDVPARLMSSLDRASVELADAVVSPSRYMIRQLRSMGWRLPAETHIVPNVNRLGERLPLPASATSTTSSPKIVFFGRLETRKGLELFRDALKHLLKRNPELGRGKRVEVIFMGKDPDPRGRTVGRLARELSSRRLKIRFLTGLSSQESISSLRAMPGALVCMPSLADNSPYVVVEAIESGLNFLTTRTGGQVELIHPADRRKTICDPTAESLCRALERRLRQTPVQVRPSRAAVRANQDWLRLSARRPSRSASHPGNAARFPLVSVFPESLPALRSVLGQDYGKIEVCLPGEAASGRYVLRLKSSLAPASALREWVEWSGSGFLRKRGRMRFDLHDEQSMDHLYASLLPRQESPRYSGG